MMKEPSQTYAEYLEWAYTLLPEDEWCSIVIHWERLHELYAEFHRQYIQAMHDTDRKGVDATSMILNDLRHLIGELEDWLGLYPPELSSKNVNAGSDQNSDI